jgi:hypothetical protein
MGFGQRRPGCVNEWIRVSRQIDGSGRHPDGAMPVEDIRAKASRMMQRHRVG